MSIVGFVCVSAQRRCDSLEQKLSQEKDQVSKLQKNLQYAVREEERRVARQNQAFQQIHRRSIRANSTTDQQWVTQSIMGYVLMTAWSIITFNVFFSFCLLRILDVIDVYESQIQLLRSELK